MQVRIVFRRLATTVVRAPETAVAVTEDCCGPAGTGEDWRVEDPHNRTYMIRWLAGYRYTEDQTLAGCGDAAEACSLLSAEA